MTATTEPAEIVWVEGQVPFSPVYQDTYYTRQGGKAETGHVFLAGNGLPERWQTVSPFTIAELGFGTGLNFLETWRVWAGSRPASGKLSYIGFEKHVLAPRDIETALAPWPDLAPFAGGLLAHWPPTQPVQTWALGDEVSLTLILGDANETLADWDGQADAWFLDGFAPRTNEAMWNEALMQSVFDRTAPGGSFATYTVAGRVRRALQDAGFEIERAPGFGHKKQMLKGHKPAHPSIEAL